MIPEVVKAPVNNSKLHTSDCEAVYTEASKYNWDARLMTAIAKAESNCRVDAKGDTTLTYTHNDRVYGYSVGAFQIRILQGREHCDSYNLQTNVSCAYKIFKSQGLKAWSVYTSNQYLAHM